MNSVIYSRVSTTEQAESGRSIGDQIKICQRFADDNDHKVIDIFKDEGKTATNTNRAGLQDMILRCQKGDINSVLVQDSDRLARNTYDHLKIKASLKKHGTGVISVSQPMLNDDTPEGQLIDTIIASANAFQSQITGRKISKCMMEKFNDGCWPSTAYTGYTNINTGTDDKPINVIGNDKEKQAFIKRAFELFATGFYSADEVNEILYKKGFKTKGGKKYSSSQFARILKNTFYYGLMKYKGLEKMGNHTRIISKEIFDRCKQVFAEHNKRANRLRKHNFLLRGFVYCGICGRRLTAEHHFNKNKSYYHCSSKTHSNKGQNIETDELEKLIEQLFKNIQLPKSLIDKLINKAREILNRTHKDLNKDKQLLKIRLSQLEKKRDKLETKLMDDVINDEVYARLHKPIEKEIDLVKEQINGFENERKINIESFEKMLLLARNIGRAYKKADDRLKKYYLSLFWDKISINDRKIKEAVPTKFYTGLFPNYNQLLVSNKPIVPRVITDFKWRTWRGSNPRHRA